MAKNSRKIICVGPNKTGTSSLKRAFKILGLKTLHDPYLFNRKVSLALKQNKEILHYFEGIDAFSDILFPCFSILSTSSKFAFVNRKSSRDNKCGIFFLNQYLFSEF